MARGTAVLANLVGDAAGTVLSVRAVIAGVTGPVGWLAVAVYGFLTLGYVLVYLRKSYQSGAA